MTKNYELVIASLLHDIGKFAQRAAIKELEDKKIEATYCKLIPKTTRYSHQHVLYTHGFIEKYKDYFPSGLDYSLIARIAASHHAPSTETEKILQTADCISSGTDRTNDDLVKTDATYFEKPLISLVDKITFKSQKNKNYRSFALQKLENDTFFAQDQKNISANDYKTHWEDFVNDFTKLKNLSCENFVLSLVSLLEHYLWCIPASTIDDSDVSLYDHSVTTAAFASALWAYIDSVSHSDSSKSDSMLKPFALISGQISGIQEYIFNLKKTTFNAKMLRAKSFEIQTRVETVKKFILKEFNVPEVCALFNAGGNWTLVLPNIEKIDEKLNKIRERVEKFFLEKYFGQLSFCISYPVLCAESSFKQNKLGDVFEQLNYNAGCAKQRKFLSVLHTKADYIIGSEYEKILASTEATVCPLCENRLADKIQYQGSEEISVCSVCNELIAVGTKLPKATSLIFENINDFDLPKICVSTVQQGTGVEYAINNFCAGKPFYKMPYYIPKNNANEPLTFEELANRSKGNNKLAMFKADVDNLGAIFSIGLKHEKNGQFIDGMTISKKATMSRSFDYFFSTYLNEFTKKNHSGIYTVFSGGDDVCVIGSWNEVIDFACGIQKEFARFTNNEEVTLSGGIYLAHNKLPVRDIADGAEELLSQSKKTESKNSITVFDTTVNWHTFDSLLSEAEHILSNVFENLDDPEKKGFSRGFVYRLLSYADKNKHNRKLSNLLWRSHFVYDVTRNVKGLEQQEYIKKFVHDNINNLRLPVSYVLYSLREKTN